MDEPWWDYARQSEEHIRATLDRRLRTVTNRDGAERAAVAAAAVAAYELDRRPVLAQYAVDRYTIAASLLGSRRSRVGLVVAADDNAPQGHYISGGTGGHYISRGTGGHYISTARGGLRGVLGGGQDRATALPPWPGYAKLGEQAVRDRLDGAFRNGDIDLATAMATAIEAYEGQRRQRPNLIRHATDTRGHYISLARGGQRLSAPDPNADPSWHRLAPHVSWILNCIPSAKLEDDWVYMEAMGLLRAPSPAPFLLRYLAPNGGPEWAIDDQGDTGACVGYATGAVLRFYFVASGDLDAGERLSARYLWLAAKETDELVDRPTTFIESAGTTLKGALDVGRRYGVATDQMLPWSQGSTNEDLEVFYVQTARLKIPSYLNLKKDAASLDTELWQRWLSSQGPILARVNVDSGFRALNGAEPLQTYWGSVEEDAHAVAIVGYTDEGFVIRNSWGTGWGAGGFAVATPGWIAEAVTEAYGVPRRSSNRSAWA